VTGAAAWLTVEVVGAAAWLTVEVTGATLATAELAWDTVAAAWLTVDPAAELPAEPDAGVVALETTPLTALVTPVTVPVTVLVTAPSRPPDEAGAVEEGVLEAGAARFVVEACALVPDSNQKTTINPKQHPRSTAPRVATRPVHPRPGITCATGAA
jgi:hypothetical protein